MSNFALVLPGDFHDYEWEVKAKGFFEARLLASGKHYRLNFYDRADMERAAEGLVQSGLDASLIAE